MVNSMTTQHRIYDFMILVGDSLIRSGASSASTTRTLLAIAQAEGKQNVTVSVTLGQLSVSDTDGIDGIPYTDMHEIAPGVLNIGWRSTTEEIVADYLLKWLTLEEAHQELERRIDRQSEPSNLAVILGFGILGGGFSLLLNAQTLTMVGAAITALFVSISFNTLDRSRVPGIFRYALAGFIAVFIATIYCLITSADSVAVCIVSALAGQLAGIAVYGATQDAMMGWYLSATGRMVEATMSTAGLVSGVAVCMGLMNYFLNEDFTYLQPLSSETTPLLKQMVGAALVTAGSSLASGGRNLRLLILGVLGLGATLLHFVIGNVLPFSPFTATTVASICVGAVGVLISKQIHLTSNAIMMLALLPLIPGMMLYQGMLGSLYNEPDSFSILKEALVLFYCLSVGGTTGQMIVSESMWAIRKRQFTHRYPGKVFNKIMVEERNAQDVILPVFSRPFSRSIHK